MRGRRTLIAAGRAPVVAMARNAGSMPIVRAAIVKQAYVRPLVQHVLRVTATIAANRHLGRIPVTCTVAKTEATQFPVPAMGRDAK